MNTDIVARGMAAGLSLWIPWAAFNREGSLPATWHGAEGMGAIPFLLMLAVGGGAMFMDILLNDTTSRKLWQWITPRRSTLYLVLAYLSIITPYSVSRQRHIDWDIVFFYSVLFFGLIGLGWSDFKAKRGI